MLRPPKVAGTRHDLPGPHERGGGGGTTAESELALGSVQGWVQAPGLQHGVPGDGVVYFRGPVTGLFARNYANLI